MGQCAYARCCRDNAGRRIVPALRGFLAAPLDTQGLDAIASPTLILTQQGDALHPLRSGEVLYDLLPNATLCVAPTATFWDQRRDETADLIAAFVSGRDISTWHFAMAPCAFKTKTSGRVAGVASSAAL